MDYSLGDKVMTDDGLIGQAVKVDGYYVFVKHDFGTVE